MSIKKIKKQLNFSITKKELTSVNYLTIKTSWNPNENQIHDVSEIHNNYNFQEILKEKINFESTLNNKKYSKSISQTLFSDKFNNTQKILLLRQLNQKNGSKDIVGFLNLNSFYNDKNQMYNYLNENKKNSQKTSLWFIQSKNFFIKMPQSNINSWFLNTNNINNIINITSINNFNVLNINKKLKH